MMKLNESDKRKFRAMRREYWKFCSRMSTHSLRAEAVGKLIESEVYAELAKGNQESAIMFDELLRRK